MPLAPESTDAACEGSAAQISSHDPEICGQIRPNLATAPASKKVIGARRLLILGKPESKGAETALTRIAPPTREHPPFRIYLPLFCKKNRPLWIATA